MTIHRNPLLNKRLPAYSGLLVLVITLAITVTLSKNTLSFVTKATFGSTPKEIQISNVTTNSFSVTYLTSEKAVGTLAYGNQPSLDQAELDERDKTLGKPLEHQIHKITVTNLQPSTKYYFSIVSGTQTISNNGTLFEVTTAATEASTNNEPLSGTVALDDGTIPTEGIVTISGDTILPLTSLINPDGTYSIQLSNARNKNLLTPFQITPQTTFELSVNTPTSQSKATIAGNRVRDVPKIVLSQNYDFSQSPDDVASTTGINDASQSAAFPTDTLTQVNAPEIVTPTDNQTFKDTKPVFKGRAMPNTDIELTINSDQEIVAKLQSDINGVWEFRPPVTLTPGLHTISISTLDASGVLQKITKSFTVYAEGSKFVEPSISPIITNTPKPTMTPVPVTPTPIALASPTTALTSPSPTANISPTIGPTSGPITPTGSSLIHVGILGTLTAIGIGTLLFIFTAL